MAIKTTVIAFVDESGGTPVSVDIGAKEMFDSIIDESMDAIQIYDDIQGDDDAFVDQRKVLIDTQVYVDDIVDNDDEVVTGPHRNAEGSTSEGADTSQGKLTVAPRKDMRKKDTSEGKDTSNGTLTSGPDLVDSNGDNITDKETKLVTTIFTYLIETIVVNPNTGEYDVIATRIEKDKVTQVVLGSDSRYKATSQKKDGETETGDY